MSRRRREKQINAAAAALVAILVGSGTPSARADTYQWTGATGNPSWSTSIHLGGFTYETNWTNQTEFQLGSVVPVSSSDTTILYNTTTTDGFIIYTDESTQDIANPFLLNSLQFGTASGSFTVDGNPLEFTGTSPTIIQNSNSHNGQRVYSDVVLGATLTLEVGNLSPPANNPSVLIQGNISDLNNNNAGLTIANGATLYISGDNSYTGVTTVQSGGSLSASSDLAAQNTTIDVQSGGTLDVPIAGVQVGGLEGAGLVIFNPLTIGNNVSQQSIIVGGNNQSTTFSGTFELFQFSPPGFESALEKTGTGAFTYTGDSSNDQGVSGEGNYLNFIYVNQGAMDLDGGKLFLQSPPTDLVSDIIYMNPGTSLNLLNNAVLTCQGPCAFLATSALTLKNSSMTVQDVAGTEQGFLGIYDTSSLVATNSTLTTNVLITDAQTTIAISDPTGGTSLTINGTYDSANASYTASSLKGTISDSTTGPGSVHITNDSLVKMYGANTYTGQTLVDGSATLSINTGPALQNSTLNLQGSGTTVIESAGATIGGLAGDSTGVLKFDLAAIGSVTATFGQNNQNTTYSGGFSQTSGAAGSESELVKTGTGEFIFNGSSSAGLNCFAVVAGSATFNTGNLSLSSLGYTGFGGQSALFAGAGSTVTVQDGFTLVTTGYASIHNDGAISLVGSGTRWSQYSTSGTTNGGILVGEAGKTSNLTVEDGAILSGMYLQIGNPSLSSNPGYGQATFESNGNGTFVATGVPNGAEGAINVEQGSKLTVLNATVATNFISAPAGSAIALTDGAGGAALTLNGAYNSTNGSTISNIDGTVSNVTTAGSVHITNGAAVIMNGTGTYTGQTLVDAASELVISSQNAVQDSTVNVQAHSIVFAAPAAVAFGGLAGDTTALVEFEPNAGVTSTVLTFGQNGQSTSYAGEFTQYAAPSGFVAGLVKTGAGVFTYTGNAGSALTYLSSTGGAVDLSGATLSLSSTNTSGGPVSSLYVDGGAAISVASASKVTLSGAASLHSTGSLTIDGSGTTFTQKNLTNGFGGLFDGFAGGTSTVTVSNGASANFTYMQIGNAANIANPGIGQLTINSGAVVTVAQGLPGDDGRTTVDTGSLTVSGGTLTTGVLLTNAGSSTLLSDPAGATALTINRAYDSSDAANTTSVINSTIADAPAGSGSIDLTNGALVRMAAANTYTGQTTVQNGSILIDNGSLASAVTAQSNSTLSGTGKYGGATLASRATISPGDITQNITGTLTVHSLTLDDASNYLWKINTLASNGGVAGGTTGWDLLLLDALTLPPSGEHTTIEIDSVASGTAGALNGFDATQSYSWLLAESSSSLFTDVSAFTVNASEFDAENSKASAGAFSVTSSTDGKELLLNYSVPEPSALALTLAAALLPARRRRRPTIASI